MPSLKYIDGDFKDIPVNKIVDIAKFTEGKVSFNLKWSDKYAKEYTYKGNKFNNGILEIITDVGTAKFEAKEKEYQEFIKIMNSKPQIKTKHPALILVGVIIVVAIIIHIGNVNNSKPANTTNTTNTTQKISKPVTKPAIKTTFADGTVNNSTVKDALKKVKGTNVLDINSKKEFKNIDVIDDGNGKTVTIVFKPQVGDETDLAKKAASTMVAYSEVLSKNKSIDKFILEFDEDFEDEYGKTSEGLAIWMEYSKNTMSKIDYGNFKESVYGDYTRPYRIADSYKIATGIYDKLKDFNDLPANK